MCSLLGILLNDFPFIAEEKNEGVEKATFRLSGRA